MAYKHPTKIMKPMILLLTVLIPLMAEAFTGKVLIDNVWYDIITKGGTATVTSDGEDYYYNGDIIIPSTIEYEGVTCEVVGIGAKAFIDRDITSITIPEGIRTIGTEAFHRCRSLTSVELPNSINSIGWEAFAGCSNLESIILPNSISEIEGYAFDGCRALKSISIPANLTKINQGVFLNCTSLQSVLIPNGITTIGGGAFSGCSNLIDVTIPSSVNSIGGTAFASCPELTNFYCYTEKVPSIGLSLFMDSHINYATLHVVNDLLANYISADQWKSFGTIVPLNGEEPNRCAKPSILYNNGELVFSCDTEGAEFVSSITDNDVSNFYDNTIPLSATYTIKVYAKAQGFVNSDITIATLCWIESTPQTEDITNNILQIKSSPMLIKKEKDTLLFSGGEDGNTISVYDLEGHHLSTTQIVNGFASIHIEDANGEIYIVKTGKKTLKIMAK